MQNTTKYIMILILGIFVGDAVTMERAVRAERQNQQAATSPLPLEELRTFTEVFSRIQSDYVEPVDDKKILDKLRGEVIRGTYAINPRCRTAPVMVAIV